MRSKEGFVGIDHHRERLRELVDIIFSNIECTFLLLLNVR